MTSPPTDQSVRSADRERMISALCVDELAAIVEGYSTTAAIARMIEKA